MLQPPPRLFAGECAAKDATGFWAGKAAVHANPVSQETSRHMVLSNQNQPRKRTGCSVEGLRAMKPFDLSASGPSF